MGKPIIQIPNPPGATPLDDEEIASLIPDHVTTTQALNSWEGANILKAQSWAFRRRHRDLLTDDFVRRLHKKMFDDTWTWAGQYRRTDKSIGIHCPLIAVQVRDAMRNVIEWEKGSAYSVEETAARIHHQLVYIHPFSNGNGRHARLFADIYLHQAGHKRFTWGNTNLHAVGVVRSAYIDALKSADQGNIQPLLDFARAE